MNAFIESPILRTNYYYDILITNIDKIEGKDRYQFDFQVSHKELVSSILKKDLKVFYGFKRSKNISLLKFDLHSPCVIYNDERKEWCRAEVLQKISDSLVAVKLVDYGGIKCVHHSYLKICDKRFLTPCLLGYSASAMTLEERFNTPATMFYEFKEEFLNKKLKCKIINYDKHSNQYVLCFDRDYYSHDPNNNTNACVERNIIKKPCWENFRKIEHLNELSIHYGKPYRITVTYVVSPNQFYVQLLENLDQLNNKSVDLQEVSEDAPILEDIEVNKACVAKWFYDNLWYRAQVVQCDFKRQQAVVRFIDFGITQTCSFTNLRQLSDVFDENKCAILVNLKNVKNQEWSEKEMNDFEELACYKQAEFDGYFEEKDKRIEWIGSFIEEKNIEINLLVVRCVKRKIFQVVICFLVSLCLYKIFMSYSLISLMNEMLNTKLLI